MKTSQTLLCLLALLATQELVQAISTKPVGFVTVPVNAGSDRRISVPLGKTAAFQGVAGSIVGNQIIISNGTGLAAFQPSATTDYYVRVSTGTQAGKWYSIVSADSNSVTVDPANASTLQAQGITATTGINEVIIYPHWTFATLFPNQTGITPSNNLFAPNGTLILFNDPSQIGTDIAPSKSYFFYDGVAGILPAGWYDASNAFAGEVTNDPLSPEKHFTVRNPGSANSLSFIGEVPTTKVSAQIQRVSSGSNDNFLTQPFPVPVSPAELKLVESGAFRPSTSLFAPDGDFLLSFDTSVSATGNDLAPSKSYFYYDGVAGILPAGWYDAGNAFGGAVTNTKLFSPGEALVVRTAPGTSQLITWTADLPYTVGD